MLLAVGEDALGGDQDGGAAVAGHYPVELVEIVVRAAGGGEDLAEQQPEPLRADAIQLVVRAR